MLILRNCIHIKLLLVTGMGVFLVMLHTSVVIVEWTCA